MKWSVIVDRSNQHVHQRFVSTWAQICSKSVEISVNRPVASTPPLITLPPRQPRFILAILAIVLSIATIFGDLFESESRDVGGFNDCFNVLNNDFKLELECDLRDVLPSPIFNTIGATAHISAPVIDSNYQLGPTGVGLHDFDINGHLFDVVFNENEFNNEINNIFDICFDESDIKNYQRLNGGVYSQQTLHPIAPGLNGNDRTDSTGVGSVELNDIECVLNVY